MATWQAVKVADLRKELKRRDLPIKGRKATLVARLEHTDSLPIDRVGRESHYKEEVRRYKEAALANLTTFPYFTKLPLELQRYIVSLHFLYSPPSSLLMGTLKVLSFILSSIVWYKKSWPHQWTFSLPGPRILQYQSLHGPICEHKLFVRKEWQPPNPAALSTCRESRAIALKRYKLCFGTTNVYADLPGGDILYLDWPELSWEWNYSVTTMRDGRRTTTAPVRKKLCDDVVKDLQAVTHIILPSQCWHRSSVPISTSISDGHYTRRMLQKFKSLKRVSLASVSSSYADRAFVGYHTISNSVFQGQPRVAKDFTQVYTVSRTLITPPNDQPCIETVDRWLKRREDLLGDFIGVCFVAGFDLWYLQEDEVKNGIPEVQTVELEHVVCMPPRVEEKYHGSPIGWCCERPVSDEAVGDEGEEPPRANARYNLRRAWACQRLTARIRWWHTSREVSERTAGLSYTFLYLWLSLHLMAVFWFPRVVFLHLKMSLACSLCFIFWSNGQHPWFGCLSGLCVLALFQVCFDRITGMASASNTTVLIKKLQRCIYHASIHFINTESPK